MKAFADRSVAVKAFLLIVAASCALLLALPGTTIVASYVNDLFIFLDGAHRIASGQVPSRDFHTPLGPLSFYIPAIGYWWAGNMGGAMPFGMALATLSLSLPLAHVLGSRMRAVIAIPYGFFLLLVVATPMNLGESVTELSFGMFYNRIGWASLGVLLTMYLQPLQPRSWQSSSDAVCAAVLILVMLYTKITYGIVAIAFVVFLLFDKRQRAWAAISLGLTLIACFAIEAFWHATWAYLEDIRLTSQVSGPRHLADFTSAFLRNWIDYTLLGLFIALVLWRTRSLRDLIFFGFCCVSGLLIQIQNAQYWGILTIHAGIAVAAEMVLRQEQMQSYQETKAFPVSIAAPALSALIVLPALLQSLGALGFHAALGIARSGEAFELPRFESIRLISPWLSDSRTMMHDYLESIENGARILEGLEVKPGKISVLDFSNPFSAGLGLIPPRGDNAWLHWGRNLDATHFIPPEQLLADVQVLMIPKWGINPAPLLKLYGPYLEEVFEPLTETESWTVYRRKEQEVADKVPL
ncbi:hypothetical protein [Microvirga solisilvae]|uniref:hypothetical protein n=1 Tax=Microvirga solisilvae TaxID=2919498 RepID=UPI001FAFD278|nr:hypothetical protein [Microvirga solisilvae]